MTPLARKSASPPARLVTTLPLPVTLGSLSMVTFYHLITFKAVGSIELSVKITSYTKGQKGFLVKIFYFSVAVSRGYPVLVSKLEGFKALED
jgi:hypothetical protein